MSDPGPIILIGAARSGTKFLRDILASGSGTAAVPYDVNYVWRYGADGAEDDTLNPANLTEKRKRFIRKTLKSQAKAGPDDILIEKTVANTLRVPFVDAVYPAAHYIHLIRDGRDVVESAMRQWQEPPNWSALAQKLRQIPMENLGYVTWFGWNFIKGLSAGRKGGRVWGPRFPGIETFVEKERLATICAKQWLESYTRAKVDFSNLADAESRVYTIRYEDLIRNDKAISSLVDHLDLPDKEKILSSFHRNLRPNRSDLWRRLPPEDLEIVETLLAPTLKELGYPI